MATASHSNVETVERLYEGFNEGDIESVLALMDDDVEWVEPEGFVFPGISRGPDAVLANVFEPAMTDFEAFQVEPDRYIDGGETIVALGTFHATMTGGSRIESPFAHVCELQERRITRFENFTDTALWR